MYLLSCAGPDATVVFAYSGFVFHVILVSVQIVFVTSCIANVIVADEIVYNANWTFVSQLNELRSR